MRTELSRVAYELSLRRLTQQEGAISELRARTGTLLAASAIAASVLGSRALDASRLGALVVLGLVAFVISILASAVVLLPRKDLIFSISGSVLAESEEGDTGGIAETYRRLAYWIDGYAEENDARLQPLIHAYKVATGALVVELSCGQSNSLRGERHDRKAEARSAAPARSRRTGNPGWQRAGTEEVVGSQRDCSSTAG